MRSARSATRPRREGLMSCRGSGCNRRDGGVNGDRRQRAVEGADVVRTDHRHQYLTVNATATACAPCSVKPLDIMVVLDRTGSMCESAPGVNDPELHRLEERSKRHQDVRQHSRPVDRQGRSGALPARARPVVRSRGVRWPGTSRGAGRATRIPRPRASDGKYYGYDAYWPYYSPTRACRRRPRRATSSPRSRVPTELPPMTTSSGTLSGNWVLNDAQSAFLQRLGCTSGSGTTSYALSIEEAQYELSRTDAGTSRT